MKFTVELDNNKKEMYAKDITKQGIFWAEGVGSSKTPALYFKAKDGIYALNTNLISGGPDNFNRWDSACAIVTGYREVVIDEIIAHEKSKV